MLLKPTENENWAHQELDEHTIIVRGECNVPYRYGARLTVITLFNIIIVSINSTLREHSLLNQKIWFRINHCVMSLLSTLERIQIVGELRQDKLPSYLIPLKIPYKIPCRTHPNYYIHLAYWIWILIVVFIINIFCCRLMFWKWSNDWVAEPTHAKPTGSY